jgi:hypothetical protein
VTARLLYVTPTGNRIYVQPHCNFLWLKWKKRAILELALFNFRGRIDVMIETKRRRKRPDRRKILPWGVWIQASIYIISTPLKLPKTGRGYKADRGGEIVQITNSNERGDIALKVAATGAFPQKP